MDTAPSDIRRTAVVLRPGEGRSYAMGKIGAVFKADGRETENRYSVSEWWLEPHTTCPGPHSHAEDDVSAIDWILVKFNREHVFAHREIR